MFLGRLTFSVAELPFFSVSVFLLSVTFDGAFLTVTLQVAVLPLLVLAVMVTVPAFFAVILPFLTVATFELEVFHVIVLLEALLGVNVVFKVRLSPFPRVTEDLLSLT